jgi:5-methyltetrahydrofolate--homocysteine methyltransferase
LRSSAVETLEGIRRIKSELPGALTILGISNVSFGVAEHARAALNSVFLHHAVQAGLDAAIVNPVHITPYAEVPEEERKLCDDLLMNTSEEALPAFIAYYESHGTRAKKAEVVDLTEGLTVDQRIHFQILHGRKRESKRSSTRRLLTATVARRLRRPIWSREWPGYQLPASHSGTGRLMRLFRPRP